MNLDPESIDAAASLVAGHRPMVALTGAGVSVESGIPDFRSAGGLWERFDPAEYATIEAFRAAPEKVWAMLRELDAVLERARPNPAHLALARLEQAGVVSAVITQNIDNLHQDAGSTHVVEFHGNGRRLVCLDCEHRLDQREARQHLDAAGVPRCPRCSSILKPDVVLFGEPIPERALTASYELASRCGVMLVAGTSATVMPAAAMPLLARRYGAALIEVNLEATELTPSVDIALRGAAGEVLPALAEAVLRRIEAA
jgi:NAD-dependent deacetylase